MPMKRPGKFLATVLSLNTALLSVLPAAAAGTGQAQLPYFRLNYGIGSQGQGTGGAQDGMAVTGGPSGTLVTRVNRQLTTSGGTATRQPVTWSVSPGLPDGFKVDSTSGVVAGASSVAGRSGEMRLVASHAPADGGPTQTAQGPAFVLNVLDNPTLSYNPPAAFAAGQRNVVPMAVANVNSGTYRLNQAVPNGLSFDPATGTLASLGTVPGTFANLQVTVTDTLDGASVTSVPFTVKVSSQSANVSMGTPANGVKDQPYSSPVTVAGLAQPVRVELAGGTLPPGLSFSGATLAGTPTAPGTYPGITVRATGSDGETATSQSPVTITVNAPSLTYANTNVPVGKTQAISPVKAYLDASTTYAMGSSVPGLSVDPSTGIVTAAPTSSGPASASVVATNRYGSYASNAFTVTGTVDAFAVSASSSLIQAHVGYPVYQKYVTSPALSGTTWSVSAGKLPDGVALNASTGVVSGAGSTPADAQGIVVKATNGGQSGTADAARYQILAAPTVPAQSAYSGIVGQAFTAVTFSATNLIGAASYSSDPSKLPPGLTLSAKGVLSGTPTQDGNFDGIVVSVTDAYDGSGGQTQPFSIQVLPASSDLAVAGLGSTYKVRQNRALTTSAPSVVNANSPVTWDLSPDSAQLPTGTTLDKSTGIISGNPTTPGDTANIILTATETKVSTGWLDSLRKIKLASLSDGWTLVAAAATGSARYRSAPGRPFTISVAPPLTVGNVQPTYDLKVASPVSIAPRAAGVLGTTTWRLAGATLPNNISFDSASGVIAGPALISGRIPGATDGQMVLTAVDSFDNATAESVPFKLSIDPGLVLVGPTAIQVKAATPYASGIVFTAANATGSLTWRVVGDLPQGLTVNPQTGEISGTAPTPGTAQGLRMQAQQDSDGTTGVSAPFNLTVQGGLQVSVGNYFRGHVNRPIVPIQPQATGQQGSVKWSVASGSLPPGIAIDPVTGAVRGTPTVTGYFHDILVGATDQAGNNGVSQPFDLDINDNLYWGKTVTAPVTRRGAQFATTAPQVAGAVGQVTFRMVATLFDWKADPFTGVVSGTANPGIAWPDWLIATDATGAAISHPYFWPSFTDPLSLGNCGHNYCVDNAVVGRVANMSPGIMFGMIGKQTFTKVGDWPDWVSLDPNSGVMSGTPPAPGSYRFMTQATDAADGATAQAGFGWDVFPNGTPNAANIQLSYTQGQYVDTNPFLSPPDGFADPVQWTRTGTLPDQMSMYQDGRNIHLNKGYTPPGVFTNVVLTATDANGQTFSQGYDVTIVQDSRLYGGLSMCGTNGAVFDTGPLAPTGASVGSAFNYDGPALPSWANFDTVTGRLTATVPGPKDPSLDQNFQYNVWVADQNGNRVYFYNGAKKFRAYNTLDFDIPSRTRDGFWVTQYYYPRDAGNYVTTYGTSDYRHLYVSAGTLPDGLALDDNGFGGAPKVAGDYPITVTLLSYQCDQQVSVSKDIILRVNPPDPYAYVLNPVTVYARQGIPFRSQDATVMNPGTSKWRIGLKYGSLPDGVSMVPDTGAFQGTPKQTWNNSFTLEAFNEQYQSVNGVGSQFIVTPGPSVSVPDTTVMLNVPAHVVGNVSGFAGTVTWSASGTLPPGMGVDPGTGALVGTPTAKGTFGPITVTGVEDTLPPVAAGAPVPAYPSATSAGFNVIVTDGPYITGVADQSRIIGSPFDVKAVANGFSGTVSWKVVGDLPVGVTLDPATGAISGGGSAYGARPVQLQATDGTNIATSATFTLTVTDRDGKVPGAGDAVWTWGEQVCTYGCSAGSAPVADTSQSNCTVLLGQTICARQSSGGAASGGGGGSGMTPVSTAGYGGTYSGGGVGASCKGRQLQHCTGTGCEGGVRGCDAPYTGGDTSYPAGTVATACVNPTISPSEMFCPPDATTSTGGSTGGSAPGKWYYRNYYIQTKHTNGFVVNYYALTCYVGTGVADNSQCGTPPTSVGQCMINGYGAGNCGSGVPFTDGVSQSTYSDGTGWFN